MLPKQKDLPESLAHMVLASLPSQCSQSGSRFPAKPAGWGWFLTQKAQEGRKGTFTEWKVNKGGVLTYIDPSSILSSRLGANLPTS